MKIRHSIVIPVYNHEKYISQCLDSILDQSVCPYEIIIGDDHSDDSSVEIISRYGQRFPDLIRFFPQKTNLGLYEHLDFLFSKVRGDIVSIIGGDDFLIGEMFEEFNKVIKSENLNPLEDRFIIAANHWMLGRDGRLTIFNNSHVKFKNLFSERLRYGISFRDCGLSRKLFDSLDRITPEQGILSDWLWGFDQVMKCEKLLLVPEAFYVYRTSIGIISRTSRAEIAKSSLRVLGIIERKYAQSIKTSDALYIKFLRSKFNFEIHDDLISHFYFLLFTIINFWNFSTGNSFLDNLRAFTAVYKKIIGPFTQKICSKDNLERKSSKSF